MSGKKIGIPFAACSTLHFKRMPLKKRPKEAEEVARANKRIIVFLFIAKSSPMRQC
jgi:hypothetical protein